MIIGNKEFDFDNNIYIMGILNVTPDSFSDGGQFNSIEHAKEHAKRMINNGADIIDVGGESTRPGHETISTEDEIARVLPIIKIIREHFDTTMSIDTSKAEVAKAAIEAGAHMINDIWGLKKDKAMATVIAEAGVPCCLMHNRKVAKYTDLINDMMKDFDESILLALEAGIKKDKIIIDPGIGFAKSLDDNLAVMKHLACFDQLGYPILLGTSKKSMIGLTLNLPVS